MTVDNSSTSSANLKNVNQWSGMRRIKNIHFVGIGGVGMSGIAEVFINLGYRISGSDMSSNSAIQKLKKMGAVIHQGHAQSFVENADVIVISSAINESNPEVLAAREKRIPIVPRAEMLAELMRFRKGIAVAGTHGKTTTTSLIASILSSGGLDPTFVIGGKLTSSDSNAKLGTGEYLVAEADESDASFLYLLPMISVITNIDMDHMATYGGDFDRLQDTFLEFLHHLPFYGLAIICIDDNVVKELAKDISRPVLTYGFDEQADIRAYQFEQNAMKSSFKVARPGKPDWLNINLNMPGRHNVRNALAAITVAYEIGINDEIITQTLAQFQGIGRRFQIYGDMDTKLGNVLLVDDYGHHPNEISQTIEAIRSGWPKRRLVVAFQPHRFSRTKDLFDDFTIVLSQVDVLVLTEVYAASELPIIGADGRSLCRSIRNRGNIDPVFVESIQELPEALKHILHDGDILLTLGAGSIGTVAGELMQQIKTGLWV